MRIPDDVRRERSAAGRLKALAKLQGLARVFLAKCELGRRRQKKKKLEWAQQVSKVDDDDLGPIDVSAFLGGLEDVLGAAPNPFALRVPEPGTPTAPAKSARERPSLMSPLAPEPRSRDQGKPGPVMAWSTPPPSAGHALAETTSSMGSPASRAGDDRPRLARSLSSTAGSAHTEDDEWAARIKDARR